MKKNLMKRIGALLLIGSLGLSMMACGNKAQTNNNSQTGAGDENIRFGADFPDVDLSNGIQVTDEEITLVCGFDLVEIAGSQENMNKMLSKFYEDYPNIKVRFEAMSNSDSRLMSMIASGSGPDIIRLESFAEAPSMIARGLLLPLDRYFEASGVDTSDFAEPMNLFRYDGNKRGQGYYYGVVKDYSYDNSIWINTDIFKEAGVEIPSDTEPMTYEQFATLARKLAKKNGNSVERFGFHSNVDILRLVETKLSSKGLSLWNETGDKNNLTEDYAIDAFKYWAEFQKEGVMPSTLHPLADTDGFGSLVEGKIAMLIGGYWLGTKAALYGDGNHDNIMMLPALKEADGERTDSCLAGTGLGVFSGSKHPNEAYLLLQYLTLNTTSVQMRAEAGWGIPALKSAFQYLPDDSASQQQWLRVAKEQMEIPKSIARVSPYALYNGVSSALSKYYNLYLYDKADLKTTLTKVKGQVDTLVEEGKTYVKQAAGK